MHKSLPIVQPVVYLDENCERMIIGPHTRSPKLAREWAQHTARGREGASYMILQNLKWDRNYDLVIAQDKFR